MNKKVLFLPQASELAPASGFRIYQYLPYLKNYNIDFDVKPSITKEKHDFVYGNQKNIFTKTLSYTNALLYRRKHLSDFLKYDCIFFQKETFPYMYPLAERATAKKHHNTVFDFDDAIFLKYRHTGFFKNMLPLFKTVIVGNEYLYNYAVKHNKNTVIIPTTIDTSKYKKTLNRNRNTINIGWSGSSTTNIYLNQINNVLKYLFSKYDNLKLTVISNSFENINLSLPEEKINFVKWNYDSTVKDLENLDVGLMPLPINRWSEGKCALKLLQYMSLNIPAICSPTQANAEVITDGENGFTASNEKEWIEKIEALINNQDIYESIAKKARATVKQNYSTEVWLPKFTEIIQA